VVRELPGLGVLLPSDIAPIPVASPGRELLLRWTGFDPGVGKGLLALNRARSRDDFEAAVDQMPGMGFNFVAADAEGIAYRVGLRVPDRGDAASTRAFWQVVDGTDAGSLWTGAVLPPERLPRSRGGERGWIATANNDPFGFTQNGRVDDDPWYYGAFYAPGWRASRLEAELARLAERGDVTREDFQALQTDRHENLADELLPLLAASHGRVATDEALATFRDRPDLDRLVGLLTDEWDGEMRRDSPGGLVFHAWSHLFAGEILEDDFGLLYGAALDLQPVYMLKVALLAARRASAGPDAIVEQGLDVALLAALDATASFLTERFGGVEPERYTFGDMKVSTFLGSYGPGLDMGSVPTDGGETTVNVSPSTFREGADVAPAWRSHWGPLERTVTTFAEDGTPESFISFPLGNVADPSSPHFRDGQGDWLEGRARKLLFRRAEIEEALESRRTLP
jgi:penicillin amidase